ncbi:hypothetical protein [Enterococcus faecalis]|uniref:hypothetical protein n=1 Tax=Enterococcus faecalis TaxID=1351 RepID=UPI001CF2A560|nr:hypothetical protein [Enterococcus faecalis]MCA6712235.1 hypothetical protein [Enterococcus faecalis]MCA6731208.1 hypothetical protein [Enterococcus faecalis]
MKKKVVCCLAVMCYVIVVPTIEVHGVTMESSSSNSNLENTSQSESEMAEDFVYDGEPETLTKFQKR